MGILSKLNDLKQHQGFIKYFKNTSWLFAEKLLRITAGLFVGIWIARYLGPEKFGLFSYTQSFVALFTAFATLGLNSIVVRELVKDQSKRDVLLGTAFLLKLIGSVIVLSLLAFATSLQDNDALTNSLIFIIASGTLFQSFNVIDFYFQSKVLSKFVVFSNTISLFISSVIKVYLLLNEASLIAFAYVGLFDAFVLSCGFIYFYFQNNLSIFNWSFDFKIAKSLLKDSWPLILSGVLISIYMKIDQIMIKEMLNDEAVGQYAVAVRLSEIWYFLPMVFTTSLFPAIINAKKQRKEVYERKLQFFYNLMAWLAILIAFTMTFLSEWIVNFLYGDQYNQAGSVLIIYIWAGVFVFLGGASQKWLLSENLQLYSAINTAIGACVNVIMNYILIPRLGIEGAAWATLVSYFIAAYLCLVLWKSTRGNFIRLTKALFFENLISRNTLLNIWKLIDSKDTKGN